MQCNIDRHGRTVRMITGTAIEGVGVTLAALWFVDLLPGWAGLLGAAAAGIGIILVVQGAVGWCAFRAVGIRTPI